MSSGLAEPALGRLPQQPGRLRVQRLRRRLDGGAGPVVAAGDRLGEVAQ